MKTKTFVLDENFLKNPPKTRPKSAINGREYDSDLAVQELEKKANKRNKKDKRLGSLHDFYDVNLMETVYHNDEILLREALKKQPQEKRKLIVSRHHGTLQADEVQLQKEIQRDMADRWFYNTTNEGLMDKKLESHRLFTEQDYDIKKLMAYEPPTEEEEEDNYFGLMFTKRKYGRPTSAPPTSSRKKQQEPPEQINEQNNNNKPKKEVKKQKKVYNFADHDSSLIAKTNSLLSLLEKDPINNRFYSTRSGFIPNIPDDDDTFKKRGNDSLESIQISRAISEKQLYHQNLLNSSEIVLFLDCLKNNILPLIIKGVNVTNQDLMKDLKSLNEDDDEDEKDAIDGDNEEEMEMTKENQRLSRTSSIKLKQKRKLKRDKLLIRSKYHEKLKNTPVLTKNNFIISLDLNNYGIGSDRGMCLSEIFIYCPSLEIIKLANNNLNDYCIYRILYALFQSTRPIYIDLSENIIESYSVGILMEELFKDEKTTRLEYLNINDCDLTDELSAKIADSLVTNTKLEVLLMRSSRIGNDEVSILR